MATLKEIRKRIGSVHNTKKITKAMKMVAAAKLRRAQQAVESARPYANALQEIVMSVADESSDGSIFNPRENPSKICFLLYTSNRGLCGGFNSNLLRRIETHLKEIKNRYEIIDIDMIGRKGREYFNARKMEMKNVFVNYAETLTFDESSELAKGLMQSFLDGAYDEVYLVYNKFVSALVQNVTFEKIIPLSADTKSEKPKLKLVKPEGATGQVEFIFEPSKQKVLETVVPKFVATQIYRAHLESVASELGSRMTAMESATTNASDMIGKLTLQYNRARQAAITVELMDIVNGAESIK